MADYTAQIFFYFQVVNLACSAIYKFVGLFDFNALS